MSRDRGPQREESPFPDVAGRPKGPLTPEAWDARWQEGSTGWELGHAGPPLRWALEEGWVERSGRALVPGCGSGHDVRLLAGAGFRATGVDLSPTALGRARALAAAEGLTSPDVEFAEADLFDLPFPADSFDLVLEHTCFCAVPPERRDDYVTAMARVLRPGGRILGLFFMIQPEEGPPFGATDAEIRHRFGTRFHVERVEVPPEPHRCPHGKEHLYLLRLRRSVPGTKRRGSG